MGSTGLQLFVDGCHGNIIAKTIPYLRLNIVSMPWRRRFSHPPALYIEIYLGSKNDNASAFAHSKLDLDRFPGPYDVHMNQASNALIDH